MHTAALSNSIMRQLLACSASTPLHSTHNYVLCLWRCGNEIVKCGCKAIKVHDGIHMSQKNRANREQRKCGKCWRQIPRTRSNICTTSCRFRALQYTRYGQMFAQLTFRRKWMRWSSRWKWIRCKELELVQGEYGDRCRSRVKNQILLSTPFMRHGIMNYYMGASASEIGEILYFHLI